MSKPIYAVVYTDDDDSYIRSFFKSLDDAISYTNNLHSEYTYTELDSYEDISKDVSIPSLDSMIFGDYPILSNCVKAYKVSYKSKYGFNCRFWYSIFTVFVH